MKRKILAVISIILCLSVAMSTCVFAADTQAETYNSVEEYVLLLN